MPLDKPYYRCYRPNLTDKNIDKLAYIRDSRNLKNPYDYLRKLDILYSRLEKIFEYVEPAKINKNTYSVQICSLLLDLCTTIEANFRDILKQNNYNKPIGDCKMPDYFLVEKSHHLSSYEIKIPFWKPEGQIRRPFRAWNKKIFVPLEWYTSYNHVKHNMIEKYSEATLDNVVDSFCALLVIMSAQFYDDSIKLTENVSHDNFFVWRSKGDYIQAFKTDCVIKFPNDWSDEEKYLFDWSIIKTESEPFVKYDYNKCY